MRDLTARRFTLHSATHHETELHFASTRLNRALPSLYVTTPVPNKTGQRFTLPVLYTASPYIARASHGFTPHCRYRTSRYFTWPQRNQTTHCSAVAIRHRALLHTAVTAHDYATGTRLYFTPPCRHGTRTKQHTAAASPCRARPYFTPP